MSDRTPALGEPILVRGRFVGVDHASDTLRIEIAVPRAAMDDPRDAAQAKWREYRDATRARGVSANGISKRDFMAGYLAAAA